MCCFSRKRLIYLRTGVGDVGAGGSSVPPKVLICWKFGQNIWKSGKKPENISKYLGKIFENLSKNGAQRSLTSNMAPNVCRITSKDHFLEATPKNGRQNLHDNFLGKFGKFWAKILCTPKNSLAPTPMYLPYPTRPWQMFETDERIMSPKKYELGSRNTSPPQYLSINHSTSHRVWNGGILFLFRNVTCPIVQSSIWSSLSMHRCYEEPPNDLPATLLWRDALGDKAWVTLHEIQSPSSDLHRTPDQNTHIISDSWQERFPDSSSFCSFNLFTKRFTPNSVFNPNLISTPHIPVWLVLRSHIDFAVYNFAHKNPSTNYVPSCLI